VLVLRSHAAYEAMDPKTLEGADLALWEIWRAVQESGQSMREVSGAAGMHESSLHRFLFDPPLVPAPATLKALAKVPSLGLSYMRMMALFGIIDPPSADSDIDYLLQPLKTFFKEVPISERGQVAADLLQVAKMLRRF